LRHCAYEAGESGEFAFDDRLAELDIAEQPVERVVVVVIRRVLEECGRRFRPIRGGGDAERFLVLKVMEESALRDCGRLAEVLDRGRRKALRTDNVPRRLEEPVTGVATFWEMLGRPASNLHKDGLRSSLRRSL
jgi:hypothetical protein